MSADSARRAAGRAGVVLMHVSGGWLLAQGRFGGDRPALVELRRLADLTGRVPKADEYALLVRSQRAVCRKLELPDAAEDETARMVELQLEAELPYPAAGAVWSWQRRRGYGGTQDGVVCLAVPKGEVDEARRELQQEGIGNLTLMTVETGLAELAVQLGQGIEVGAADVRSDGAVLVVANGAGLTYARWAVSAGGDTNGCRELAAELEQSLQHYALGRETGGPTRLLLTGDPEACSCLQSATDGGLETACITGLGGMQCEADAGQDVLCEFGPLVGALLALHRTAAGESPVAPLLQERRPRRDGGPWRQVATPVAICCALVAGLVWAAFSTKATRLESAKAALAAADMLSRDASMLSEEVEILTHEQRLRSGLHDLLLAVTEALPPGTELTDLQLQGSDQIVLLGKVHSVGEAAKVASALGALEVVESAELVRATREQSKVSFRIVCAFK